MSHGLEHVGTAELNGCDTCDLQDWQALQLDSAGILSCNKRRMLVAIRPLQLPKPAENGIEANVKGGKK